MHTSDRHSNRPHTCKKPQFQVGFSISIPPPEVTMKFNRSQYWRVKGLSSTISLPTLVNHLKKPIHFFQHQHPSMGRVTCPSLCTYLRAWVGSPCHLVYHPPITLHCSQDLPAHQIIPHGLFIVKTLVHLQRHFFQVR